MNIGILALQGDFDKHAQAVHKLGHSAILLKDADKLSQCQKLIIPGGESTTIIRLIEKLSLREPLLDFANNHAIMGTCAGLIVLGDPGTNLPFPSLELIDIKTERNAYGRQIDSFIDTIQVQLGQQKFDFEGVFIRAPKISVIGDGVKVLANHGRDIVMARNERILVATFHPELTDDTRIHQYFIENFE